MARFTAKHLQGVDSKVQNNVVCKFLSHPIMSKIVPPFLQDFNAIHQNHEVIQNIKADISTHLVGSKKSHLVMAKDIICTLASSQTISSSEFVAKVLEIDRQNIKKGLHKRIQEDLEKEAFWRNNQRYQHTDPIFEEMRALVISWWTTKTKISSNCKDI